MTLANATHQHTLCAIAKLRMSTFVAKATHRSKELSFEVWRMAPNKSLLRAGGRWYLVCKSLAGIDKVPMISLSEPPGAELSR
jgi:hypothetical protein